MWCIYCWIISITLYRREKIIYEKINVYKILNWKYNILVLSIHTVEYNNTIYLIIFNNNNIERILVGWKIYLDKQITINIY